MKDNSPTALVILDGFGYSEKHDHNALSQAKMPHFKRWIHEYPHALLSASGTSVGLLPDMIGNSAVGHLTIGAGRIIDQPIKILLDSIKAGTFPENQAIIQKLQNLAAQGKTLHIIGLLSDAGVHCHIKLIRACMQVAQRQGVKKIIIHPILDGRDAPPKSAETYLKALEPLLNKNTHIGTLMGRFYAMDRNNNWDRTSAAYTMLTHAEFKNRAQSWQTALHNYYAKDITDEFIPPTHLDSDATIEPGDGVIFCNIRADRARQLTQLLRKSPAAWIITGIPYDREVSVNALYTPPIIQNTLLEKLSKAGKTIFTCAESEKYAHVTYFFNGGKEAQFPNETRVIIPSHSPVTFIEHPEMCAPEITQAVVQSLRTNPCDFYLINYANPDMVGHSGNLPATVTALECIDAQLAQLYEEIVVRQHGTLYITSDHGKAEQLWNSKEQQPDTAHTTNPVPFIMLNTAYYGQKTLPLHTLADIAPFTLLNMKIISN